MNQHSRQQQYPPSSARRSRRFEADNALQLYMIDEQQLSWGQISQAEADRLAQRTSAVQPPPTINTTANLSHLSSYSGTPLQVRASHSSHFQPALPDPLAHGTHRHLAGSALFSESIPRHLNDVQRYNDQRSTLGVHNSSRVGSVSSTGSHAVLLGRDTDRRNFDDVPDFTGLNSGTTNGPGPPNRLVVSSLSRGSSSHTVSAFPDTSAGAPAFNSQRPVALVHTLCDICGKGPFGRLNELRRHRATVHEPPKWVCGICGNRFKRKDDRERHKRVLHHLLGR